MTSWPINCINGSKETTCIMVFTKCWSSCAFSVHHLLEFSGFMLDFRLCLSMGFSLRFAIYIILPSTKCHSHHIVELLDFNIILIKPVLMFSGVVTNGFLTGTMITAFNWLQCSSISSGNSDENFSSKAVWKWSCLMGSFRS